MLNPATEVGFPVGAWLSVVAVLGGLSVALGAFGAHALEGKLSDQYLEVYKTAVQYQMIHTLALLGVAILGAISPDAAWLRPSAWLFLVGTLLFSGSLYALVFSGIRPLGIITPFGGLAFILGWAALAMAGLRWSQHP